MNLAKFDRVRLAHLPTPIEFLPRLTEALGGPDIYVKRDDCTGLATGGNKTRKLEFLMADALAHKATVVITQGAVQSNHVRQTAAAATKLGLKCEAFLENRIESERYDYCQSGNVLLDHLFRATTRVVPAGTDMNAVMEDLAAELRDDGEVPYIIPGGGSNPIGALGYVNCALETTTQLNDLSLNIDTLIHATGSTGTQAGLVTGMAGCQSDIEILGVSVKADQATQKKNVRALAAKTIDALDLKTALAEDDIQVDDRFVGEGYGLPHTTTLEALRFAAELEGLILDPVYSGKAMAGLIGLVREGRWTADQNVLFLHTGGSQALFGYNDEIIASFAG